MSAIPSWRGVAAAVLLVAGVGIPLAPAAEKWHALAFLCLVLVALTPLAFVIKTDQVDEDDWWTPVWSAPPIIASYVFTVVVLAVGYLRRSSLIDVSVLFGAAASAWLVGSFLGIIVAIPRSLQHSRQTDPDGEMFYSPNTNLEQISDWLTKIIVGITLVQYQQIVAAFDRTVAWMARSLGDANQFFSGALLVAYLVMGFFCVYIWTRLRFTRDLTSLERSVRDSGEYLEGLANAYLYQSAPKGYRKSLKLAQAYLDKFGRDNDRVWLYVACACGQQYRDLKLQYGKTATEEQIDQLAGLEKKVCDALLRVEDLAPGQYDIAYSLWNPEFSSEDGDDLRALFPLPSLVTLFGDWKNNPRFREEERKRLAALQ